LAAGRDKPLVNLCLVIRNWGEASATLQLNGWTAPCGKDFRFGYRDTLEGRDLIVWVAVEGTNAQKLSLAPVVQRRQ
jgi:hypothetical protein